MLLCSINDIQPGVKLTFGKRFSVEGFCVAVLHGIEAAGDLFCLLPLPKID